MTKNQKRKMGWTKYSIWVLTFYLNQSEHAVLYLFLVFLRNWYNLFWRSYFLSPFPHSYQHHLKPSHQKIRLRRIFLTKRSDALIPLGKEIKKTKTKKKSQLHLSFDYKLNKSSIQSFLIRTLIILLYLYISLVEKILEKPSRKMM